MLERQSGGSGPVILQGAQSGPLNGDLIDTAVEERDCQSALKFV